MLVMVQSFGSSSLLFSAERERVISSTPTSVFFSERCRFSMMYELCSSFQLQSLSLGYVCSPKLEGKALSQKHLNVPCDR